MAIQSWGASSHPHPYFSFVQDLYTFNYVTAANSGGKGMNFPLKQTTSAGPIDLQAVVDKSAQGLNVDEQKKNVTAMAFNELLPIMPLWERYGNNPALEERAEVPGGRRPDPEERSVRGQLRDHVHVPGQGRAGLSYRLAF